jgi:fibulin 1/2
MIEKKCPPGFAQDTDVAEECVDINECRTGNHSCNLTTHDCINSNGWFSCTPKVRSGTSSKVKREISSIVRRGTSSVVRTGTSSGVRRGTSSVVRIGTSSEVRSGASSGARIGTSSEARSVTSSKARSGASNEVRSGASCRAGFKRNRWSNECEDVNECEIVYQLCLRGQTCQNTIGSYVCNCQVYCQLVLKFFISNHSFKICFSILLICNKIINRLVIPKIP